MGRKTRITFFNNLAKYIECFEYLHYPIENNVYSIFVDPNMWSIALYNNGVFSNKFWKQKQKCAFLQQTLRILKKKTSQIFIDSQQLNHVSNRILLFQQDCLETFLKRVCWQQQYWGDKRENSVWCYNFITIGILNIFFL